MTPKEYANYLIDTVNRSYIDRVHTFEHDMHTLQHMTDKMVGTHELLQRDFDNYYASVRNHYFYVNTKVNVYDAFGFVVSDEDIDNYDGDFYNEVLDILCELADGENFELSTHTRLRDVEFWRVNMYNPYME